ncbi:Putative mycofactocin biosynthesis glycosyltransferase MftF [Frondihabitans sp. 762G35]|uniref:glycosyltransferase family 2 protein n=1 Tax=Frondihabitans sp. 762G35 TaxID=1446794 RepID=UPI000D204833|nr:glycosyltransferase [Frondihabitans sp. 762G35]ARC56341.1 Putative mycofactocin biosynthesis glycosyltransferase MftF [Frondihabitans sp. 762G35]
MPTIGVVSLTQGRRPADLARSLTSLLAQEGVSLDVVCVGNGGDPGGLPEGVRPLVLPDNVGIPAGRNRGADAVAGEFVFFLDDDASLPSTTFLRDAVAVLDADPGIGLLQPRVTDPGGRGDPRRWIPRLNKGRADESSDVFSVWEGAVLLPRAVFDACGGWGEPYFYAHEGIELAWRVWAAGRRVRYDGRLVVNHPAIDPARHSQYYRLNARNRVWLAKRNLPLPLMPVYVGSWTLVQVLRWARRPERLRPWFEGFREGWARSPGGRRSMGWRTVWRMTRAGRPPVI